MHIDVVPSDCWINTYEKNEVVGDKHYTNMLTSGIYCIKLIFTIIFFCNHSSIQKQKTNFHETKTQITLFPSSLEEGADGKRGLRQIGGDMAMLG